MVLSEELAFLQQGMHSLEGERNELVEKVTRMEAELRDTQATLNASRVDCHCERDHLIVELQFPFHLFTCVLHVHNLLVHTCAQLVTPTHTCASCNACAYNIWAYTLHTHALAYAHAHTHTHIHTCITHNIHLCTTSHLCQRSGSSLAEGAAHSQGGDGSHGGTHLCRSAGAR